MTTDLEPQPSRRRHRKPSPLRESYKEEREKLRRMERASEGHTGLQLLMAALGLGHVAGLMDLADHMDHRRRKGARKSLKRVEEKRKVPNVRSINVNVPDRINPSKAFMPK